jgi:hypothetical protein
MCISKKIQKIYRKIIFILIYSIIAHDLEMDEIFSYILWTIQTSISEWLHNKKKKYPNLVKKFYKLTWGYNFDP